MSEERFLINKTYSYPPRIKFIIICSAVIVISIVIFVTGKDIIIFMPAFFTCLLIFGYLFYKYYIQLELGESTLQFKNIIFNNKISYLKVNSIRYKNSGLMLSTDNKSYFIDSDINGFDEILNLLKIKITGDDYTDLKLPLVIRISKLNFVCKCFLALIFIVLSGFIIYVSLRYIDIVIIKILMLIFAVPTVIIPFMSFFREAVFYNDEIHYSKLFNKRKIFLAEDIMAIVVERNALSLKFRNKKNIIIALFEIDIPGFILAEYLNKAYLN